MEFCQDSQYKLEIVPTTTEEYVDSLTFLDEIQEQVRNILSSEFYDIGYDDIRDTFDWLWTKM